MNKIPRPVELIKVGKIGRNFHAGRAFYSWPRGECIENRCRYHGVHPRKKEKKDGGQNVRTDDKWLPHQKKENDDGRFDGMQEANGGDLDGNYYF